MNLALKYRPREFSEVVGQRATSVILNAMIAKNKLSQVLLFTGPSGVGKTSMARIIAAKLNPEAAEDIHAGHHPPSVLEIDAASNGSVERIRALKRDLTYVQIGHKVIILDEAHAISDEGKAALLNLLEFPPSGVTFILITTESHRIPKTIRHRCDRYEFKLASFEDIRELLASVVSKEGIDIESDLLHLLAGRAEGSYREALMLLEQVWVGDIKTVAQYNELRGEADFGPGLISSAFEGPVMAVNSLESVLRYTNPHDVIDRTIETLRDVMILKGGLSINCSGQALDERQNLATRLGSGDILKVMRIMWDLQTKLSNADPVRGLEMAYTLIGELLNINTAVADVTSPSSARMSFEQMKKFSR